MRGPPRRHRPAPRRPAPRRALAPVPLAPMRFPSATACACSSLPGRFTGPKTGSMAQPVIGLTLDSEPPGGYSKSHPWSALRKISAPAVAAAGALPILLPHEPERAADYLALIQGLI